ncbi:hypothetical protein ACS0TY_025008 [Phlomoides rotata]
MSDEECGVENERQTVSLLSSSKRIKEMPIDLLSVLPDSLLVHILSFLSMEEAGRTSVLSKRWEFLWAELPRLEFRSLDLNLEIEKALYFVSLVNRTLDIRKRNYLEEFRVTFPYVECFASDVDFWIEFSVKSDVKKLSLMLLPYWSLYDYYTPPQMMYSCSSLTTLHMSRCIMIPERKIEWQSLTNLFLEDVELDQSLIDDILSSCPVLYDLSLERCRGFNRLDVSSRYLNYLRIEESGEEPNLEISTPYIRDLDIAVFLQGRKFQLKNISSVVAASIDFSEFEGDCTVEVMSNAKEFLENFKHVKNLMVYRGCFEVLSIMAVNGLQLPQSKLQKLTLASCSEFKHGISGIISLLDSSPNLEKLVLDMYETEGEIVDLDPGVKSDLDGDLLHLKTIRVDNFADRNGEPLLTLAQILLRRAHALEEMMIVIDFEDTSNFVNIGQTLLTYPRSSTRAEIHLFNRK